MFRNIVFIGGIHGVGKSSFCKEVIEQTSLIHLSASHLINTNSGNKLVKSVNNNQDILINNLKAEVKENKKYILDGHFCLLNEFSQIERVSEDTFIKISPAWFIVLHEDIHKIKNRLFERDNRDYNIELLTDLQNEEIQYSKELASKLKIPYLQIKSNELAVFLTNLKTFF